MARRTTRTEKAGRQPASRTRPPQRKNRRRPWRRLAAVAVAAAVLQATAFGASDDMRFFRIGTGSASGTYFPIGGLIANIISHPPGARPCDKGGSCGVPGLIAVAESTQGSVDNVERLRAGEIESGLVQADIAYWAYTGTGTFAGTGRFADLRAIANLYPEKLHVVVRRDSGIAGIPDLRGRRVSLGEKESGTLVDARIVLKAWGLTPDQLEARYLSPGPAVDLLRKGELDAMFFVAGEPVPAIAELAERVAIRLIPLVGRPAESIMSRYPFFTDGVIRAGAYKGVDATRTLSVGAQWVVSAKLEEDLAYGITRALWHERARHLLDTGHPEARRIRLETALDGIGIPLHPGAARYYREVGLLN